MKKTVITIAMILLCILIAPTILLGFALGLPAQYDESFYGGMAIKYDRLRSVEGKKIVIIGGSSVAFGLRSDLLEEELGIPVVNYGLYANLGTKYMIDTARSEIGEGDIVIIAPEQNTQALSMYVNGEAIWDSADGRFSLIGKVLFKQGSGELCKDFLKFVSGKFGYWKSGTKPCPAGVYNVHSFNAYGDIDYEGRQYNVMPLGYDDGMRISYAKEVISEDFIEYINDFAEDMHKRGASALYAFCPVNKSALTEGTTSDDIYSYYRYLAESLRFDILGSPENRVMGSEWFYDSNFHLNASGAIKYTGTLAKDLKAYLEDYSPIKNEELLSVSAPVPPTDSEPDMDGENWGNLAEVAKIFSMNLVESNGAVYWAIENLTDYGKTLTEIEIPDNVAGVPVRMISASVFAGNSIVTKITLGVNVFSIGHGAFEGCSSLSAIYITSLDPDSFHPTQDILSGAAEGCRIYIPQSVYASQYLTNYFWAPLSEVLLSY